MRGGPTPETDPVGFRWTPADRPVRDPWPVPEESPGGSWAINVDGKQERERRNTEKPRETVEAQVRAAWR